LVLRNLSTVNGLLIPVRILVKVLNLGFRHPEKLLLNQVALHWLSSFYHRR
jgi:hypothetical protein